MPPTFPFHVAPQLLVQVPLLLFQVQFLHPVEGGDRMGTAVPCPGAWLTCRYHPCHSRDHELSLLSH